MASKHRVISQVPAVSRFNCASRSNNHEFSNALIHDLQPTLLADPPWQQHCSGTWDYGGNQLKYSKVPDKSTKELVWIDSLIEAKRGVSRIVKACGEFQMQQPVFGLVEDLACSHDMSKSSFSSRVQDDEHKACSSPQNATDWEVLTLEEAFSNLDQMAEVLSVDNFICIVQKCRKKRDLASANHLLEHIRSNGLEAHKSLGNYIVPMFVECGSVSSAQEVFDRLVYRNAHSWTSLMSGYVQCGQSRHAWNLYRKMQESCVHPSSYTLVALLKACASLKEVRETHLEIADKDFERDIFVGSALVDSYAKCGALSEAQDVFDKLPVRNVVSWTTLIAGYAEFGSGQEALNCYEHMQVQGLSSNNVTLVCILKACGSLRALDKGREVHTEIVEKGFLQDIFIGSTLVDMYAKCGSLLEAREVFNKLPVQDVVSWNALIAGYVEHGPGYKALDCFEQMQMEGVSKDAFTLVCVLKSCGNMGAIDKGLELHAEITMKSYENDLFIGNTLVDMYAKCGSLAEAQKVFDKLRVRDVVSWNAMIKGYGTNHEGTMAIQYFECMQEQGMTPDAITFTCLLSACSHANLVHKGREFFKLMTMRYGIVPTIDHFTCLVDLLARSGHLCEAEKFLETMTGSRSKDMWIALLSACKSCSEIELGFRCFQQLVQIDPECSTPYMLMANIYASAGRQDDAYRIEDLRKSAGAKKKPAIALIEVNKKVKEFVVGDDHTKEISEMLEIMNARIEEGGHVPNLDQVLRPIPDEEKGATLCLHVEKLAIAYGLLNTPQGQTLRVTKNLRMCTDCHHTSKTISRIERREIIVREAYQVHHFKDGFCSCGDLC